MVRLYFCKKFVQVVCSEEVHFTSDLKEAKYIREIKESTQVSTTTASLIEKGLGLLLHF